MSRSVSDLSLHFLARRQARALIDEFGAGAALFANGQRLAAERSCAAGAAAFWKVVLELVMNGGPVEETQPAAPIGRRAMAAGGKKVSVLRRRRAGAKH